MISRRRDHLQVVDDHPLQTELVLAGSKKASEMIFWKIIQYFALIIKNYLGQILVKISMLLDAINFMFSLSLSTFFSAATHLAFKPLYRLDLWGVLRYLMLV